MRWISTRVGNWIWMALLALVAGTVLTGDVNSDPIAPSAATLERAVVSTGLVTFRADRAVRVNAAEVDPGRPPRVVKLTIKGRTGAVLAQTVQTLTPGNGAVLLDLARADLPPSPSDPLIRAEVDFNCQGSNDMGPITGWEVFDTISGAVEVAGSCGCPCCEPSVPPTGALADCGDGHRVSRFPISQ